MQAKDVIILFSFVPSRLHTRSEIKMNLDTKVGVGVVVVTVFGAIFFGAKVFSCKLKMGDQKSRLILASKSQNWKLSIKK
jgi:hypothetical protein